MDVYTANKLATYNAEVHRGIVHTAKYDEEMKRLQELYDEEMLNMPGVKFIQGRAKKE